MAETEMKWYVMRAISGKEGKEKLTDNSNFFVLGPSGSGKGSCMVR